MWAHCHHMVCNFDRVFHIVHRSIAQVAIGVVPPGPQASVGLESKMGARVGLKISHLAEHLLLPPLNLIAPQRPVLFQIPDAVSGTPDLNCGLRYPNRRRCRWS